MNSGQNQLGRKVAVGTIWSLAGRLIVKSLGFISILILARILAPDDFGVIAATMIMVGLLEILFNFSFDINIIQKKEVTKATLNSAWTCKLLSGLALTLLLFFGSHAIALFFVDPRLVLVVQAIALLPLLKSAKNIGFVLYRKELDLKSEFKLDACAKAVSFIVTVTLALLMQSYWALLLGIYSNVLAKLLLSYWMHPYRPWFCLREARELFSFSKWLLLSNIVIFINRNTVPLIVGRIGTSEELGTYSISSEISNLPTTELLFPLSRAIYPGYVKLADDYARLRSFFLRSSSFIVSIVAPISFGIYVVAEELVQVSLGGNWSAAVNVLSLLAIAGLFRASVQSIGSLYIAIGKPRFGFYVTLYSALSFIPIHYLSFLYLGLDGVGYSMIFTSVLSAIIGYFSLVFLIGVRWFDIVSIFFWPLTFSLAMVLFVNVLDAYFFGESWSFIQLLLAKTLAGALLYMSLILIQYYITPSRSQLSEAILLYRQLRKQKK